MRPGRVIAGAMLAAAAATASCQDERAIVLRLDGADGTTSLLVRAKRYHDDGSVELLDSAPVPTDGAVGDLNLLIELPAAGRYAVHLVATGGEAGVVAATGCYDVSGTVQDGDVLLVPMTTVLDADGDTFPEDIELYCAVVEASGHECDRRCNEPEYRALLDCNPGPAECLGQGTRPYDLWCNPFETDPCGSCFDEDCYQGDVVCEDLDGDGVLSDEDCDDRDPDVSPAALEGCAREEPTDCTGCDDGIDNDCDGAIDEACVCGEYTECPTGQSCCPAVEDGVPRCVDLTSDEQSCGRCNRACPTDSWCCTGRCGPAGCGGGD